MKPSIQDRINGMIHVARSFEIDASDAKRRGQDPVPFLNKADSLRRVVIRMRRRALLPVS